MFINKLVYWKVSPLKFYLKTFDDNSELSFGLTLVDIKVDSPTYSTTDKPKT